MNSIRVLALVGLLTARAVASAQTPPMPQAPREAVQQPTLPEPYYQHARLPILRRRGRMRCRNNWKPSWTAEQCGAPTWYHKVILDANVALQRLRMMCGASSLCSRLLLRHEQRVQGRRLRRWRGGLRQGRPAGAGAEGLLLCEGMCVLRNVQGRQGPEDGADRTHHDRADAMRGSADALPLLPMVLPATWKIALPAGAPMMPMVSHNVFVPVNLVRPPRQSLDPHFEAHCDRMTNSAMSSS